MSLVRYRKPGERIQIGNVTIRVGRRKGSSVQLIIDAPRDTAISFPSDEDDWKDRREFEEHEFTVGRTRPGCARR